MSKNALDPDGEGMIEIRCAVPADHEVLAGIRRRAILELAVPAMSPEEAERWANRSPADRALRAILEHDVWLAAEGETVGWVEVAADRVAALYVLPRCGRRGVGSRLLLEAETTIRNRGHAESHLEASPNAERFYLARGYRPSGPRTPDGALPMRKRLIASCLTSAGALPDAKSMNDPTAASQA